MDRVFLDANILFAAAYRPQAKLSRLWGLAHVILLTSVYAVEEARRNLPDVEQRARLDRLLGSVQVVPRAGSSRREERRTAKRARRRSWRGRQAEAVPLPLDDQPILRAAVEVKATHLLTGNHRDFGASYGRRIAGVLILPPAEYPALAGPV